MASMDLADSIVSRTETLNAGQNQTSAKAAAIDAVSPRLAIEADLEGRTRLLHMPFIGIWIASVALLVPGLSLRPRERLPI